MRKPSYLPHYLIIKKGQSVFACGMHRTYDYMSYRERCSPNPHYVDCKNCMRTKRWKQDNKRTAEEIRLKNLEQYNYKEKRHA